MTTTQQLEQDRTESGDRYARNQLARAVVAKAKTDFAAMADVPATIREAVNALMAGDDAEAVAIEYLS